MEHIEEFAYKIGRLTKSKAYLDFCEEVCGYRLYLFNMLDREQLDFIIRSIPLTSSDCILDLGCGAGSILNFLADKYGCSGIGLDRLERDVFKGNRNSSVSYVKGDMDRLRDYHLHPTVALSIDSLYFSRDLNALLRDLFDLRNCRKYIFYSQYLLDESARDRSRRNSASKLYFI
jgi:SAM-dependent methyltransferase